MKFSLNWLREFVETKDLDPQKIGEALTLHTCELEEVIHVSENFDRVFAGKLTEVKKHENSDKLHVGLFDCGKEGKKQIIFGQVFELTVGEIYPIALDGAKLASGIEIKNSEVRGMKSEGMVCTCQELGMKQETLLRFEEDDCGKPLPEIVPEFGDILFDIDNKSLTHRPDLMGHRGMAREVAAIWDKEFESEIFAPEINSGDAFPVKIETDKCQRFCAVKLENVKIKPSDLTTQARLENVGVRAISNLVDLTNLSLAGFGQPMHVFDADKIEGGITIRCAKKGEALLALDGEIYELIEEDIVVADDKKVLSLAGIMGGLESSVTDKTTNIVFESANFDATSVRHTSARLGLRSESSMRYEKSLDPEQCLPSILWAAGKAQQLCEDAKLASSVGDAYPEEITEKLIDLCPNVVRSISGIDISNEEIIASLESLGFEVWLEQDENSASMEEETNNFVVKVPSWRATKDVDIAEDLIEEVVRLRGFDNVPSLLPTLPVTPPRRNLLRELEWKLRDMLAKETRNEVYLTSFVGPHDAEWIGNKEHVTVQNGANEEYEKLRRTLVSNAVRGMESELRTRGKLNLFEIGTVFPEMGTEKRNLLLFSAEMNKQSEKESLFFKQKSELIKIFHALNLHVEFHATTSPLAYFHPAQCADIVLQGVTIGNIAVLHPGKNPVKGAIAVFTELDLSLLEQHVSQTEITYAPLSQFPAVRRDLSLVVKKEIQQSDIEQVLKKECKTLISIELFDVFIDAEKIGSENKNVAFHLTFQSRDKTLDDASIDAAMKTINNAMKKNFDATLRLAFDQEKS